MGEPGATPWDLKALSIVSFLFGTAYVGADTSQIALYGVLVSGAIAEAAWALVSFLYLGCAYGIWKKKLIGWDVFLGLTIFWFGNQVINVMLLSSEVLLSTAGVAGAANPAQSRVWFWASLFAQILLVAYLWKRRSAFTRLQDDT